MMDSPSVQIDPTFSPGLRSLHFACAGIHMVEELPRQGRLEGCHRMAAATHPI